MKLDGGEAVHCLQEEITSDIWSEAWQPSSSSAGAAGCSPFTCVPRTVTTSVDTSLHMQMMIWSGTQILVNKHSAIYKMDRDNAACKNHFLRHKCLKATQQLKMRFRLAMFAFFFFLKK